MKKVEGIGLALFIFVVKCYGQQVPDLIAKDNYLPYLTEQQKQEKISEAYSNSVRKKYPLTSQELYPHLYKGQPIPLPPGISGTSADPAYAISRYGIAQQSQGTQPTEHPFSGLRQVNVSIDESNRRQIEADMTAYNDRIQQRQQILAEASRELYKPEINYGLGLHTGPRVDPFQTASNILQGMMNGTTKKDFLRAIYAVESAVDRTLTWEEFNSMFQNDVQVILALMKQDNLSTNDNLGKIMTIFKFMADTTKVFVVSKEKTVISKPMLYDYEDYGGKKDITKVFVSKLLRTGTGQCMSLPTLFYLYAKAIGADVNLVFAPEHSYITFRDRQSKWQNIELTGRMFTTTDFYWQTGFIKSEQVKSGIYLKPLTEQEVLVHLMTTLAKSYGRTFGTDERMLEMAKIAHHYAPNDLSANMLLFGYKRDLYGNINRQYEVYKLSQAEYEHDEKLKIIEREMYAALDHLKKDLGYDKMPDWAYQQWLDGVNSAAQKQQHIVRKRQLEQQLNK